MPTDPACVSNEYNISGCKPAFPPVQKLLQQTIRLVLQTFPAVQWGISSAEGLAFAAEVATQLGLPSVTVLSINFFAANNNNNNINSAVIKYQTLYPQFLTTEGIDVTVNNAEEQITSNALYNALHSQLLFNSTVQAVQAVGSASSSDPSSTSSAASVALLPAVVLVTGLLLSSLVLFW